MRSSAANRRSLIAAIMLAGFVLSARVSSASEPPPIVRRTVSERTVNALTGPIVFIASESESSNAPTVRSWSAEENVGGSENLVGGPLSPGDFTVNRRRIVVRASGYKLTCSIASTTKRDEESESTSKKIVSYDTSPTLLDRHSAKSVSIGGLDCRLETPDARVLTGTGSYTKSFQDARGNASLP